MVFKIQDVYTSSGSVQLFNSWTPYVSKFDTSSFYNWEQDNLPLYDVEERTYELWEQAGFPTSAIPGLSLTVSAWTPAATLAADNTIFSDVSSCIAAIPKIIRFPVLVEICNYGNLGKLELHNFRIEEGGSLEIINRGYSKVYNASATVDTTGTPTYNAFTDLPLQFKSADLSSTLLSGVELNVCTSSLGLSANVVSAIGDPRVSSVNSFLYPQLTLQKAPLAVSLKENAFMTDTEYVFLATPYETDVAPATDDTLYPYDVSATNQATALGIKRDGVADSNVDSVGGSVYLNYLNGVSVRNCNGPLYLRNFCVNGEKSSTGGTEIGFEITNSDVVLENCAAARCGNAGFKFNNSKVVLSRSAFSYRNYDLSSATGRKSKTGIGFHGINSDISISALVSAVTETGVGDFQASGDDVIVAASRNYVGFKFDNSRLHGGYKRQWPADPKSGGITEAEQNTSYGMLLNNSEIDLKGLIDVYGSSRGIEATDSKLTYEELCVEDHSNEGLTSYNSVITFDSDKDLTAAGQSPRKQVDFKGNSQHLSLKKGTSFSFERKNNMPVLYGCMSFSGAHGTIMGDRANVAAISVEDNSDAEFIHCKLIARDTAGSILTTASVPTYGLAAKAIDNSKLSFFGTGSGCSFIWGPPGFPMQQYNAGVYGGDGSIVNFHGPTVIAQYGVDVLVENNSTINITPPHEKNGWAYDVSGFNLESTPNQTSVELHSTRACLVANKNSTLNIEDLGAWDNFWADGPIGAIRLAEGVDYPLQSSFDSSSFVKAGSLQFYPNPYNLNAIIDKSLADLFTALPALDPIPSIPVFGFNGARINSYLVGDDPVAGPGDRGLISYGGMCVRATQNSVVNVKNVHFPTGNQDSTLDGPYYNVSGGTCDYLMIWNIADTSRLNASYCSVSGLYPADAGYQGPSSLWMSAAGGGGVEPASGAPSGTPDTGVLSVFDTFGAGSGVWIIPSGVDFNQTFDRFYPVSRSNLNDETARALAAAGINVSGTVRYNSGASGESTNNKGVFRIYWSPKSSAKLLQNDGDGFTKGAYPHGTGGEFIGELGPVYQLFSQGYNTSAPVSAIMFNHGGNVSGSYPDLLKLSYDSDSDGCADQLWTSGFYYCGEFVEDNPSQCMLDESASDTFANSKNASLGWSGKPRKVTLYRSGSNSTSGSESFEGNSYGFRSSNIFDLERDV